MRGNTLHSLKALMGASVIASDGEMGAVSNFLIDDQSWTIRYLVVDVGHWSTRRHVLISAAAVGEHDWTGRALPVSLTKQQVRNSPDAGAEQPVSRQQEIAMNAYYGWPDYWADLSFPVAAIPAQRQYPVNTKADPHLWSGLDMTGYEVWATDGEIGRVEDFVIEKASWHLNYLIVRAGDWLCSYPLLVTTRWVESVSWADFRVNLNHRREGL